VEVGAYAVLVGDVAVVSVLCTGVDLHAGCVRGRQPVAVRTGSLQPVRVVRSSPVQRAVRPRREPVHARQQPLVLRRITHAARYTIIQWRI